MIILVQQLLRGLVTLTTPNISSFGWTFESNDLECKVTTQKNLRIWMDYIWTASTCVWIAGTSLPVLWFWFGWYFYLHFSRSSKILILRLPQNPKSKKHISKPLNEIKKPEKNFMLLNFNERRTHPLWLFFSPISALKQFLQLQIFFN